MIDDFRLPWSEMDPLRHAAPDFEEARKPAVSALRRSRGRTSIGREQAERDLRFLVWSELGGWSNGWYGAASAGGTSRVWRGAESVSENDEETIATVIAALEDWHGWLVELAGAFEEIAEATSQMDDVDAIARAANDLLPRVLERTGAQGDWARTYAKATSWCTQACGRATVDVAELVTAAIAGRFEAGAAPSSGRASEVIDDLALEVAARERPPFVDDALETWWAVRAASPWGAPSASAMRGAEGDAHRAFIRRHDRYQSTARADAMTRALVRARWGAKQPVKLDRALLMEWMELALMTGDVTLRKGEAVDKLTGERAGRPKDLEARLAQALKDATDEAAPALSRAARVYLDLCHMQPFTDGNSRIARLTFDYVLTRGGLGMHDAAPVFTVRRWAHDKKAPWRFQKTLAACVGPA